MADKRESRKTAAGSRKAANKTGEAAGGLTDDERAAMREHIAELKAAKLGKRAGREDNERAVLEKIAAMAPADRTMAERIHAIVKASAPDLSPKLWYGMPAYARDGAVVCFFQDARKFKVRYATLGFSDKAHLDDGNMWPNAFALMELTSAEEARIASLVRKANS